MSIKHFIFGLLLFSSLQALGQVKEDIYLKHNIGTKETIQYSLYRDGHDKKPVEFEQKFSMGNFIFGNQYFEMKPNTVIGEVTKKEAEKLNVFTLENFFKKREATKETQLASPNSLFNKIYVLVPNNAGNFFRFEVQWKEMFF
jgi:hypothetical protein